MEIFKMKDMKGGWFVGDFDGAAYRTKGFEVSHKIHPKGEKWDKHYHSIAIEINCLIKGEMIIGGKTLVEGDIFIIHPNEIADPEFLKDCELIVIKTPSVPGDKHIIL